MEIDADQRRNLQAMVNRSDISATMATRVRIVLWYADGRSKVDIAKLAGVSRPTVDLWLGRYDTEGVLGLIDRSHAAPREQVPARIRARILAATRTTPPADTGFSHWSSREMAKFIKRTEGVTVSHNYVAKLWRENDLKPHQTGTFKVSRDPAFAEKVADVVGLYLDPPEGAVVLSIDEKTQIQALDRTQPMLPIAFGAREKRTSDYVRNGTTNLFAALNVGSGEVFGECKPDSKRHRLSRLPEEGCQAACGQRDPCRAGQSVHAHHSCRGEVAVKKCSRPISLHAGRFVVAQPDRDLVRYYHTPIDPSRNLLERQGSDQADTRLHQQLEHERQAVRVDCFFG